MGCSVKDFLFWILTTIPVAFIFVFPEYGLNWLFCGISLVLYCIFAFYFEKHESIFWLCTTCSRNSNTDNLQPNLQSEGTIQPSNSLVQTPIIDPSNSLTEQRNNEPRNTENLGSFIQNSLNAASETFQTLMPNIQADRETNNQTSEENNRNIPTEVISNITESNENESIAQNRTSTNVIVNLGYFMQNSLNAASQVSQTLMENHGFTNRQTYGQTSEQTESLPNRIDELTDSLPNTINDLGISDVVINIEPAEPGGSESAVHQNLLPPSYNEVIDNETDLNFPPPTYSDSLRLSKSWII